MKKSNVLISIIIPAYNSEKTILNCLNSVINQTYEFIEIIVVNDGSNDSTGEIVALLSKEDSRIRLINIPNGGVSKARNLGISLSVGFYIVFVDSDDTIHLDMISNMVRNINNNSLDLLISGHEEIHDKFTAYRKLENFDYTLRDFYLNINYYLRNESLQSPWAKLFCSSIIKKNNIKFDENLDYGEDTLFVLEYLNYCNRILIIDIVTYKHNVTSNNSLSRRFNQDKLSINLRIIFRLKNMLIMNNVDYKKVISERSWVALTSYLKDLVAYNNYIDFKYYYNLFIKRYRHDIFVLLKTSNPYYFLLKTLIFFDLKMVIFLVFNTYRKKVNI